MARSTSDASLLDSSALFSTEHGAVHRTSDRLVTVHLGELTWTLDVSDVAVLQTATQSLAGDVYRCGNDCRWQLRIPGRSAVVLSSDEVLRLDTLLRGAVTMLELDDILTDTSVNWSDADAVVDDR